MKWAAKEAATKTLRGRAAKDGRDWSTREQPNLAATRTRGKAAKDGCDEDP